MKAERYSQPRAASQLGLQELKPRGELGDGYGDDVRLFGGSEHAARLVEAIEVAMAVDEQAQRLSPPSGAAPRSPYAAL
jgi:hypothetical protein